MAVHHKYYEFTKEGLSIHQELVWKQEATIEYAYLAMLPIKRKSESGAMISDHARIGGEGKVYDVSCEGHELNAGMMRDVRMAEIWGESSGIYAKVTILSELKPSNTFFIQNNKMYNKIYFSYVGSGGEHTTQVGEIWHFDSHYDIYRYQEYVDDSSPMDCLIGKS